MGKHRVFLAAPAGADRAAFRAEVRAGLAPGLLAAVPQLAALSACLVDATPAVPPWQRPGEAPAPAEPAFDAVIDAWGEDAALEAALAWLAPRVAGLPRTSIRVAETVEKDGLARPAGRRAPGVKFLALMCFHDDLPPAAARRLWTHHASLALRVHIGMGRYVRDWVEAIGPEALPVPRFGGVAELHFPSAEVMAAQWFDSEAGRQAIIHDVGHFLARATRLYTTEHVLKAA
ncbi:EthD domain-containing protein [Falsiroseomonas ponticola]|uniref:EthD domain-containing protein n=1 Tax=Falsiroseomonas ponticola TaxID=2786951 RepID=UPI001931DD3A|nr:EthD domain-containing protein [Roseomonas ponticola]